MRRGDETIGGPLDPWDPLLPAATSSRRHRVKCALHFVTQCIHPAAAGRGDLYIGQEWRKL